MLDIIKAVFAPYAVADFDTAGLSAAYKPLPYCVQYRETDFNFVHFHVLDEVASGAEARETRVLR